jgi:hypothetical protein
MLKTPHLVAIAVVCAMMGACQKSQPPATGDNAPVATINDQAITVGDVKAEQGGAPPPTNAQAASAMNRAAVQSIVNRELMARAAEAEKIDQTPGFKSESARAADGAKAAALARQVIGKVPPPSDATIQKFITDNPRAFAERKFLVFDQLQLMGPMPPEPADLPKTLEAYQAFFDKAGVAYQRRVDTVASGAADPKILQSLMSMAPNVAFEVNNGRQITVNQLIQVRPAPLTGAGAKAIARSYLANQAAEAAAKQYLDGLRTDAKTKIKYEPGYEPEAPKP